MIPVLRTGCPPNAFFYSYVLYCLKIHISAHLIESYPREYGSWSWAKKKLSIPLEAHDKAQLSKIFLSFLVKNLKSCNSFYLLANPAETAYLSFRDQELSNDVQLVQFRQRKVVVYTFLGWSQAELLRKCSCRNFESHNFLSYTLSW